MKPYERWDKPPNSQVVKNVVHLRRMPCCCGPDDRSCTPGVGLGRETVPKGYVVKKLIGDHPGQKGSGRKTACWRCVRAWLCVKPPKLPRLLVGPDTKALCHCHFLVCCPSVALLLVTCFFHLGTTCRLGLQVHVAVMCVFLIPWFTGPHPIAVGRGTRTGSFHKTQGEGYRFGVPQQTSPMSCL